MQKQRIEELKKLAHSVDARINLFEGFTPKETEPYKGELLFWRQVVSIYGLFADCDRVQVKEKNNLIKLMNRYSLIEKADCDLAIKLWDDVSELRKWFCHNNDNSLYYAATRQEKIKDYLNSAFVISTNKPNRIDEIQQKDWNILTFNLDSRFEAYLDILKKGFSAWKKSQCASDLIEDWILIFSKSLFSDGELIRNVLADIATYEKLNQRIFNISTSQLANSYFMQLEAGGFSVNDITDELRRNSSDIRMNKEIILESIRNSHLI